MNDIDKLYRLYENVSQSTTNHGKESDAAWEAIKNKLDNIKSAMFRGRPVAITGYHTPTKKICIRGYKGFGTELGSSAMVSANELTDFSSDVIGTMPKWNEHTPH